MRWCVGLSVVVCGCLVQLCQGQAGGVPLPLPSGPPVLNNAQGTSFPHVPLEHAGVPLPLPGPEATSPDVGNPVVVPLGGVPLSGAGPQSPGSLGLPGGVPLPPYEPVGGTQDTSSFGGPGGIRPVRDPAQDPDVQRIVRLHAVRERLQQSTRADTAVKIGNIVTAHKQVVSGQLVYLTLRVGETNCPVGTPNLSACQFDPSEDSHICEIVVWERPWLNSTKVVEEKSRCAEVEDDNDFDVWGALRHPVTSPSEFPVQILPEGITQQQLGLEAFNYVDRGSESKFRGELVGYDIGQISFDPIVNTTKVHVNVEYGFNLCLRSPDEKTDPRVCPRDHRRGNYICSVTVVHNPNQIATLDVIPFVEDDDDIRCERKLQAEEELVVPVRAPCTGCLQPAPLADPTILELADFALKEYDRISDDDDLHMILKLVKAHTQVVAGVKYYLTIELAETHCKKQLVGVDVNRTFCAQDLSEETKYCDLHVVDQPWVPSRDLVASQCYDKDEYPHSNRDEFIVPVMLGAGLGASPSFRTGSASTPQRPLEITPQTLEVAKRVVNEYNRREDDDEFYKFVKLHEASSQDGMFRVVVEMAETNCHKRDPTLGNGDHCVILPSEDHEVCRAEVLMQPTGAMQVASFYCDDLDDYLKETLMPHLSRFDVMDHPFLQLQGRTSIEGATRMPVNDSRVTQAATYVTDQYNLREDDEELYVLTQVISANMMNNAGLKFLLEVELAETHCKKYLPVADPSRCVIDHGEEREICQAEVMMPSAPGQPMSLNRLYCDERDDYFLNRIRGSLSGQPAFRTGGLGGQWVDADVNDKGLTKYGIKIADEFDLRSDEDNLFIFHKVLKAQKQVQSGLKFHMMVELVETICPKYKRRINKARCAPDIGEDHMICEAKVLVQPWLSNEQVMDLHCTEKEDYHDDDNSLEVTFPRVHPTAHARPVFRTQFIPRDSIESEESNERFYQPSGRRNIHRHDTDEDDSDELPRFRGKRSPMGGVGAIASTDANDAKVQDIAKFAIESMDQLSDDPYARAVEEVLEAKKQVVAGTSWKLTVKVHWTTCTKGEDTATCEKDTEKPSYICYISVWEKVWMNFKKVTESNCSPVTRKSKF